MPTHKITPKAFAGQTFYVGLDVHKKSWSVTVRTAGLEVEHFAQTPDPVQLARHLKSKFKGASFLSAYEAGFSGTSAHTALCGEPRRRKEFMWITLNSNCDNSGIQMD